MLSRNIATSDFVPIEIEKEILFVSLFHRPLNLLAIYVVMLPES